MRIAFISDIHSNAFYLKRVIKAIEREKAGQIYCLGDLVGYYDDPNGVIDILAKHDIKSVCGNHEKYVLGRLQYGKDKERFYRVEKHRSILKQKSLEYLFKLPDHIKVSINGKKLYMTHSKPNDCVSYVREPNDIGEEVYSMYDYYCFGHSHLPVVRYDKGCCILNPGSVGQPRDYTRQPSF